MHPPLLCPPQAEGKGAAADAAPAAEGGGSAAGGPRPATWGLRIKSQEKADAVLQVGWAG
jgi:hypothetical protein